MLVASKSAVQKSQEWSDCGFPKVICEYAIFGTKRIDLAGLPARIRHRRMSQVLFEGVAIGFEGLLVRNKMVRSGMRTVSHCKFLEGVLS